MQVGWSNTGPSHWFSSVCVLACHVVSPAEVNGFRSHDANLWGLQQRKGKVHIREISVCANWRGVWWRHPKWWFSGRKSYFRNLTVGEILSFKSKYYVTHMWLFWLIYIMTNGFQMISIVFVCNLSRFAILMWWQQGKLGRVESKGINAQCINVPIHRDMWHQRYLK